MKIIFTVISVIAIVAASALRTADFLFYFDSESGFFTDNGLLSYIALAAIFLLGIIGALIIRKKISAKNELDGNKNIASGIVSLLSAAGFFYSTYSLFLEYAHIVSHDITETTAMGISMRLPFVIFTLLVGVYFLVSAYVNFSGNNIFAKAPVLPLIPVVWAVIFTLFLFMHYSISVLHSENAFVILSAVFGSYAFLQYAFSVSKINVNRFKKLTFSSLIFASLSVSFGISSLIKNYFAVTAKGDVPLNIVVLFISAGVFLFSFVLSAPISAPSEREITRYKPKRYRK